MLFASPAMAECPDQAGDSELDVVTFNAWGLPAPIAKRRRSRLPQISNWLNEQGYDVVGLQEVWRGALPMLSLDRLFAPPSPQGDSGLALYSRLNVRQSSISHFETARGIERLKEKGWMTSTVDVPGFGELAVWNTHLQAQYGDKQAKVRSRQMTQILEQAARNPGPMVLVGDFNLYSSLDEDRITHDRIVAAGFVDVADATGTDTLTYDQPGEHERFDRVYVRNTDGRCLSAKAVEVIEYEEGMALSDHKPVKATFTW